MFELTRLAIPQEESARTYKAELDAQKAEKKAQQYAQKEEKTANALKAAELAHCLG